MHNTEEEECPPTISTVVKEEGHGTHLDPLLNKEVYSVGGEGGSTLPHIALLSPNGQHLVRGEQGSGSKPTEPEP